MGDKGKIVSCIVSGVIFIIFGVFFGVMVILTGTDEGAGVVAGVILIALFAVGTGVWQISRGIRFRKDEPVGVTSEDKAMKELARAEEKHEQHNRVRKPTMRAEICGTQRSMAVVTAALCVPIALVFSGFSMRLSAYYVIMGALIAAVLIYGFADVSYRKTLKTAKAQGLDENAVSADFLRGEIFKDMTAVLCIGNEYTVFADEIKGFVVRNSDIRRAFVIREAADMYNTMVYSGSVIKSYLILDTAEKQYKFRFPNRLDRHVIDAYISRAQFLSPSCEIYPAEDPLI